MNKMYIPKLGDIITLGRDWTFRVIGERRNYDFIRKYLKLPTTENPNSWLYRYRVYQEYSGGAENSNFLYATIPAQSQLKIERIYVRQRQDDFNSVTFRLLDPKGKSGYRFFAKLDDVNNMWIDKVDLCDCREG